MPLNFIALGGAECVWRDYKKARTLCPHTDVGAVNEAGINYEGRLTLWATLHPEKAAKWHKAREQAGRNSDFLAVSHKRVAGARVDEIYPETSKGSSGLYLCEIAIALGYQRIIVCGMPMDDRPHFFDEKRWMDFRAYRKGWLQASSKIRSMSGWTREVLGAPDNAWLAVPEN